MGAALSQQFMQNTDMFNQPIQIWVIPIYVHITFTAILRYNELYTYHIHLWN